MARRESEGGKGSAIIYYLYFRFLIETAAEFNMVLNMHVINALHVTVCTFFARNINSKFTSLFKVNEILEQTGLDFTLQIKQHKYSCLTFPIFI